MKLLLVEDEPILSKSIARGLKKRGYMVDCAYDGEEALELYAVNEYDLMILDLNLPKLDGMEVLRQVRQEDDAMRILILSARTAAEDKIEGLDAGCSDYLTKPFRVAELRARVAAHLRREARVPTRRVRRGAFDFDLASKTLYHGDAALPLTKSEYAICEHLATHAGQVFSKEQIYEAVFGYDGCADDSAVTEHVKNIRAKLKAAGGTPIETVWGIGYKWKNEEM
mgnify:CR=1 FL=1